MVETGKTYLQHLRRQWQIRSVASAVLLALGITVLLSSLVFKFSDAWFWWAIPVFAGSFLVIYKRSNWNIAIEDVSRFLNSRFPQLEESSQLLIKPRSDLSLLEQIQANKIEGRIGELPLIKNRGFISCIFLFLAAITISIGVLYIPLPSETESTTQSPMAGNAVGQGTEEVVPVEIQSVNLTIIPPAYTRKSSRTQQKFSLLSESGSQIIWKLRTTASAKNLILTFSNQKSLRMKPTNADSTSWEIRRMISEPGFYQLRIDGQLSELFPIEIIKDQPATIRVTAPEQYSTIDFGQPQKTPVKVAITDDYGIRNAVIIATTARGQGEGVKFKEQQLSFQSNFSDLKKAYNLQKTIDLKSLGMIPGDELYFYVKALDNFNQESRSEVYFVSIQDTAELMSMDGLASGVDLVPEYFRSMRQIIIDTERLIREKPSISAEAFKSRSNELGTDQKLLRLRYGKFLGEESSEHEHDDEDSEQPSTFGDQQAITREFGHDHDNSEDATFFEPELKAQLKATLTEMWNSELRLRTYRPVEALPFEYKALRLLKDLQQKERVYVAKTAIKTPVLKPENRLSGELDKVINPFNQRRLPQKTESQETLKQVPEVLNKLKSGSTINADERQTLVAANKVLTEMAASKPALYLGGVVSLRRIIDAKDAKVDYSDFISLEKALKQAIPKASSVPKSSESGFQSDLSSQYFKNLNRTQN